MIKTAYFAMRGGLNDVEPPVEVTPGYLIDGLNYEHGLHGGYRVIEGYERYDAVFGPPSQATFHTAILNGLPYPFVVGDKFSAVFIDANGDYVYEVFELLAESPVFLAALGPNGDRFAEPEAAAAEIHEYILVGPTFPIGTLDFFTRMDSFEQDDRLTWYPLAVEARRNAITSVPGIGPVRGVTLFNNRVYAFRDRSDTEGVMYEANPGGWNQKQAGLVPGGRYDFEIANFRGHTSGLRLYGCDGKNPAFEFDGTTYTPIDTGMPVNTPTHVTEHKKHLFLSFPNGSLQFSQIGEPLLWNATLGAGEIATAGDITTLTPLPGDVLMVGNRHRTYVLHGTPGVDLELREHSDTTGVLEWSAQRLWTGMYADDRGLLTLEQVQAFGDFADGSFSQLVQRRYQILRKKGITASILNRDKNQYRLFFEGGWALYCTFDNRRIEGITLVKLSHTVRCTSNAEQPDGTETLCFGSDDGYVYQMDAGNSFDGVELERFLHPVFNHNKSPDTRKRYRRITLDFESTAREELRFQHYLSSIDREAAMSPEQCVAVGHGDGIWNHDDWDQFVWHGEGEPRTSLKLDGTGRNFSFVLYSKSAYTAPHTVFGATVHFQPRRLER